MFCKHCGTAINDRAKFCTKCGEAVSDPVSAVGAIQAVEFKFSRTWLRSSVVIAVILTIFFGLIDGYGDGFADAFIGVVFLSAILAVLVTFVIKWRREGFALERSFNLTEEEMNKFKGLNGWLAVVGLALFISVGFSIYGIAESVSLFTSGAVEYVSNPTSDVYIPGYAGLLKFELILDMLFLLAGFYLIYLYFKRNKLFPKYYILFLVSGAIYMIIDYLIFTSFNFPFEVREEMNQLISEQGSEVARTVIGAIIWGTYMVKSKRVKATFIES
ncbi:hypothetical protein BK005_01915 [bacterium CG10_37_50]|uniref:Zinc-ribbon domain-containing protein n=1 Tax=Candidatus Campbellbacteria bacterium CG22_combo_CG10-13_8_21_14_all_36_13 TaxID=1974529 RepID=A0A2H0E0I3_9BACT|nr:MAG: hypothetical protein BK005_01915 [bacterium CG10_37_50]PIP87459.1 MAG: hypothetical protein COW81_00080 [Candidatus Campbellbacteria bacterium CG22_combo_CG10-13_8_21_14_all_36_13]